LSSRGESRGRRSRAPGRASISSACSLPDAALPTGFDTYRGYRFEWAGQPGTLPTATAVRNARRTTTVHAIWNGATAVARWRILAGRSATKLVPVRTAAWNGLDTTVKITRHPKVVEVVALDQGGSVIATSKPARVHY
jgi:hypothetical protein